MKQGIHPNYHKVKCICTSCGAEFETGSTIKGDELRVDTCSNCHHSSQVVNVSLLLRDVLRNLTRNMV